VLTGEMTQTSFKKSSKMNFSLLWMCKKACTAELLRVSLTLVISDIC